MYKLQRDQPKLYSFTRRNWYSNKFPKKLPVPWSNTHQQVPNYRNNQETSSSERIASERESSSSRAKYYTHVTINIPLIGRISKPKAVPARPNTVKLQTFQRYLGLPLPLRQITLGVKRNTFSVAILSPTIEKSKSRDILRVPARVRRATPWGVSRTE